MHNLGTLARPQNAALGSILNQSRSLRKAIAIQCKTAPISGLGHRTANASSKSVEGFGRLPVLVWSAFYTLLSPQHYPTVCRLQTKTQDT